MENPTVIDEYDENNKILKTEISTDFINIIVSIYSSCFINTFKLNSKLLLVIITNINIEKNIIAN